jgi:nucleotide-binding universal stress UspA family protein
MKITMDKKILLPVDDSIHSRNAIHYAVRISSAVKNLTYTLYHAQPSISHFLLDEAKTDGLKQQDLNHLAQKHEDASRALLDKCKKSMMDLGVNPGHIQVVTQPRKLGRAKDIIEYAQQGHYDAIVVGRRGISRLQETFAGSITSNLLEHSRIIPVWVIDGQVTSTRIMIAVDGSESSLKAVDHLSFMTAGNVDIAITIFHVVPRFSDFCPIEIEEPTDTIEKILIQGDKRCIDHFYALALQRFKEAGFQDSQIHLNMVECLYNIGGAIVEEARAGDYGTVVVGRRGGGNAFFMGSVSRSVLGKSANCALWVVS